MSTTTKCPACKGEVDGIVEVCPHCGEELSVSEDTMDAMIKAASIPNLGSLIQAGKDQGLIQAGAEYGNAV